MTWAVVAGVRRWQGDFPEPSDKELRLFGYRPESRDASRKYSMHSCADCPTLIRVRAARCTDCYKAHRTVNITLNEREVA